MGPLIVVALVGVAVLFFCLPALIKADTRRRRRTDPRYRPMGSLGIVDELYHPTAYAAFQEAEAEQQLPAPAPSPGDPLRRRHYRNVAAAASRTASATRSSVADRSCHCCQ